MSFASRLTRHPIPFSTARGEEGWAILDGVDAALRPLVTGTAGSSPYLSGLILREAAWLSVALHAAPEYSIATLIA